MGRIRQRIGTAAWSAVAAAAGRGHGARHRHRRRAPARRSPARPPTVTAVSPSTPLVKPLVILYGDSLAWEAQDSFVARVRRPAGSAGPHPHLRRHGDLRLARRDAGRRGHARARRGRARVQRQRPHPVHAGRRRPRPRRRRLLGSLPRRRADRDRRSSPRRTRGSSSPAPRSRASRRLTGDFHGGLVNAMYAADRGPQHDGVDYVDAGAAVLDHGRWTPTLPCLPGEPCTGGTDRARPGRQRGARPRRRPLLPRGRRGQARCRRRLPGVVERRLPLRQRDGPARHPTPPVVGDRPRDNKHRCTARGGTSRHARTLRGHDQSRDLRRPEPPHPGSRFRARHIRPDANDDDLHTR